jgi:hypothetical protein
MVVLANKVSDRPVVHRSVHRPSSESRQRRDGRPSEAVFLLSLMCPVTGPDSKVKTLNYVPSAYTKLNDFTGGSVI